MSTRTLTPPVAPTISSLLARGIFLAIEHLTLVIRHSIEIRHSSFVIFTLILLAPLARADVKLREETLVIPTYKVGPPDPNPRFYSGRTYQGAKATFYPYPVYDSLTDDKTNQPYKAVYLENQYIRICVLPELGGRIFEAVDKANNYDFFYHQHVIKPALIGMLGAWISGGVEWNVPHHHRASSFLPVDYTTQKNADGSKTLWLSEIELRHRMKWLIGLTLYPDRSYIEMTCRMFNRTPFAQSMLFWINPAVHANENYQVIFPPDTEWAAQHAKPEFASWPIARQRYGGTDYTRGVDISWWKNHSSPVSFFCFHSDQDFFGGYDHGKKAGVLHVADHNVVPGKKFFEWGNGSEGETWTKNLTDNDGPYLELMAGAWSDNQPDYSWIQPGETREWKHYWYPVRNMGGFKAANENAALNFEITNRSAIVAVNTTRPYKDVIVELSVGGQVISSSASLNLSPQNSYNSVVPLPDNGDLSTPSLFEVAVRQNKTNLLISYKPLLPRNGSMPQPVEKPKSPTDYKSTDELYFTGQRVEQLHSPSFEAAPYYEEMLKRDPGDYRANTALGILLCKQWKWEQAANHLRSALKRATANYIRPKDGEASYYLGVALRNWKITIMNASGSLFKNGTFADLDGAAAAFHKAAWSEAWKAAAYYQLAEIECQRSNLILALDYITRSLAANARNPKALDLRSAILRHQGDFKEALQMTAYVQAIDPLDLGAKLERHWAEARFVGEKVYATTSDQQGNIKPVAILQGCAWPNLAELRWDYGNAGLKTEAELVRISSPTPNSAEAFPFQFEMIDVLASHLHLMMTGAPQSTTDPIAAYELGNLLYDNQPERAINVWEVAKNALALRPQAMNGQLAAIVHRNLGFAYAQHEKNPAKAIESYEKAIELNPKDPRYFYELDLQYEAAGAPVQKRLDMLTQHHDAVALRDDSLTREITLLTVANQADRALELLRTHHFRTWEGSREIHNVYAVACLRRGEQNFAAKKYREALQDFEAAMQYPENLEVGRSRREPKTVQAQYLIGTAHEALGTADQAKSFFEKAAAGRDGSPSESQYYHALALQKLGRKDDAAKIFDGLIKQGQADLDSAPAVDYFAKFGEKQSERVRKAQAYFLTGLGYLGQGNQSEAQAQFKKALEQDPGHFGANFHLLPN